MEESDDIRLLADYSSNFDAIFTVLKKWVETDSRNSHAIATNVCKAIRSDIYDIAANLVFIMQEAESREMLLASRDEQAQGLLDLMQDLLDLDSFSVIRPLICKRLLELSEASGRHPHCFALSGLQKVGRQVAAGGFGDIWKGLVRGQSVSLKIVRLFDDSDIKAVLKEFTREALVWRQLCHPNLLPFFGLYYFDTRLCLVSPWMENGNIMQFLKREPIMMIMVRVSLMLDVALGLQYLHEQKVIHGDLKGINVLITPSRRACICDFGLSSIVNEITLRLTQSTSVAQKGTPRYYAPELLRPQGKKSFASDVYAFACVCYEILTEKLPFYEEKNDMVVMFQVLAHGRPSRPAWCTGTPQLDNLWDLLRSCWEDDPQQRPKASYIVDRLVGPLIHATTSSSTTDWDEKFTSRFRRSSQSRPLLPSISRIERMLFGDEVAGACKDCFPDPEELESGSEGSEPTEKIGAYHIPRDRPPEAPSASVPPKPQPQPILPTRLDGDSTTAVRVRPPQAPPASVPSKRSPPLAPQASAYGFANTQNTGAHISASTMPRVQSRLSYHGSAASTSVQRTDSSSYRPLNERVSQSEWEAFRYDARPSRPRSRSPERYPASSYRGGEPERFSRRMSPPPPNPPSAPAFNKWSRPLSPPARTPSPPPRHSPFPTKRGFSGDHYSPAGPRRPSASTSSYIPRNDSPPRAPRQAPRAPSQKRLREDDYAPPSYPQKRFKDDERDVSRSTVSPAPYWSNEPAPSLGDRLAASNSNVHFIGRGESYRPASEIPDDEWTPASKPDGLLSRLSDPSRTDPVPGTARGRGNTRGTRGQTRGRASKPRGRGRGRGERSLADRMIWDSTRIARYGKWVN